MKRILAVLCAVLFFSLAISACQSAPATAPVSPLTPPLEEEPGLSVAPSPEFSALTPTELPTLAPLTVTVPAWTSLPDLKNRRVIAATANDYPPLNFIDPLRKQPIGLEYELAEEICRRLNCRIEWRTAASWDTLLNDINQKRFDIGLDGITATPDRRKLADFSEPYLTLEHYLLVRNGEARFADRQEFGANPKLKVGAIIGTTSFYVGANEILDGNERNSRLRQFTSKEALIQALVEKEIDMAILDSVNGQETLQAHPQLTRFDEPLEKQDFRIVFSPKSDLFTAFNATLAQMAADGTLDYLNHRWFSLTDPLNPDPYDGLSNLKNRRIVVGVSSNEAPLNFADPTRHILTGWEIEAITEICRRLNCQIEWKNLPQDGLLPAVYTHEVELGAGALRVTPERKVDFAFSRPVLSLQPTLLIRTDEVRFTTLQEFRSSPDLKVGVRQGSSHYYAAAYELLQSNEKDRRIQQFPTLRAAIRALAAGKIDAVLLDTQTGQAYVAINPHSLTLLKPTLPTEIPGLAFPQDSDLREPFNAALATMQADGFINHLNTRWFYLYDPATP